MTSNPATHNTDSELMVLSSGSQVQMEVGNVGSAFEKFEVEQLSSEGLKGFKSA